MTVHVLELVEQVAVPEPLHAYVVLELINVNRRLASKELIAWFVILGLFLGFATEFVVEASGV